MTTNPYQIIKNLQVISIWEVCQVAHDCKIQVLHRDYDRDSAEDFCERYNHGHETCFVRTALVRSCRDNRFVYT